MPGHSITEFMEIVEPIVEDKVAKAALEERRHVVRELGRELDRATSLAQVREWYALNVALLDAMEQL